MEHGKLAAFRLNLAVATFVFNDQIEHLNLSIVHSFKLDGLHLLPCFPHGATQGSNLRALAKVHLLDNILESHPNTQVHMA